MFSLRSQWAPPKVPLSPPCCLSFMFLAFILRSPMVSPYPTWTISPSRPHQGPITATSSSYKDYALITGRGSRLGVSFSIPKIELIHWRTNRDRAPPSLAPIHLDGSVFRPKNELTWLGYWLTPSFTTTPYLTKDLAKAQEAFVAIKRLSPPGTGLAPFLCHRLVSSLLLPILSYGGDVFTPTVHMVRKLAAFWHKTQRWCTNCLTCSPTDILAIEACLPPLDLLFAYERRLAGLRILCSPPEINPVTARLPPSVQNLSLHLHAPDHRALLRKNAGSCFPLPWLQPCHPLKNRAHLLSDTISHSPLLLLGLAGLDPLPVTSQHLLSETYPAPPPGRSYP